MATPVRCSEAAAAPLPANTPEKGAVFEGTYPLGSGVYMAVKIECFMNGSSSMYGTNENDYWGTNTVTGEMIKLGMESWKFGAKKQ